MLKQQAKYGLPFVFLVDNELKSVRKNSQVIKQFDKKIDWQTTPMRRPQIEVTAL
ncbi:hypothetical protein P4S65_16345 [Pseudoalteromonas sp. B131b]|uniref:hypothetical protein n=1 Tax=Pseudoalteromonas sp. B131b TaxID=630493 RepID=UPI000A5BC5D4